MSCNMPYRYRYALYFRNHFWYETNNNECQFDCLALAFVLIHCYCAKVECFAQFSTTVIIVVNNDDDDDGGGDNGSGSDADDNNKTSAFLFVLGFFSLVCVCVCFSFAGYCDNVDSDKINNHSFN